MTGPAALLLLITARAAAPAFDAAPAPSSQPAPADVQAVPTNAVLVDLGTLLVGENAKALVGEATTSGWPTAVLDHLRGAGIPVKAVGDVLFQQSIPRPRWTLAATVDAATSGKTGGGLEVEATITWRVLDTERSTVVATIVTHSRAFQGRPNFLEHLLGSAADELARHDSFRQVLSGASLNVNDASSVGTLAADAAAWKRVVRKHDLGISLGVVGVLGGTGLVLYTDGRHQDYLAAYRTMPKATWATLVVGNTAGWMLLGGGVCSTVWGFAHHRPHGTTVLFGPGSARVTGTF